MIRLDAVTFTTREHRAERAILRDASFAFTPGIWHLAADPPGDARLLVHFLANDNRGVLRHGPSSWPLAQFAPFGAYLSGLDIVDALCSLYALERRGTFRLFEALLDDAGWLAARFDRWPPLLQRQFGHIAFLAPSFDNYLIDVSPVFPAPDFLARWLPLFRARIAGKTIIMASGQHRAALRDFPGETVILSGGALRRRDVAPPLAMAAE